MMHTAGHLTVTLITLVMALSVNKAMAQEAAGIALPVNGQLKLWDMRSEPPVAVNGKLLDDAVAGGCYALSDQDRTVYKPVTSCFDYYSFGHPLEGLEAFTVSGQLAFNDVEPDYAFRGLELRGIDGISDCGERDDCSTVYLAGFSDVDVTAQAFAAARAGQLVTLTGRKVWNAESIDMVVERIAPAR